MLLYPLRHGLSRATSPIGRGKGGHQERQVGGGCGHPPHNYSVLACQGIEVSPILCLYSPVKAPTISAFDLRIATETPPPGMSSSPYSTIHISSSVS